MTYFLGVLGGLSQTQALTVARADQYIDDNPFTWPFDANDLQSQLGNPVAMRRLALYHFTQTTEDPKPTADEIVSVSLLASDAPVESYSSAYEQRRVLAPDNAQLRSLLGAANWMLPTATNPPDLVQSPCARAQLFGEYLHALQDSFGHRDSRNAPIGINQGWGHGLYGHEPDKTYNERVLLSAYPGAVGNWAYREQRTLEMEREVFGKIQSQFGKTAQRRSGFSDSVSGY